MKGASRSTQRETALLQACDSTQAVLEESLVPEQSPASSDKELSGIKPDDRVPEKRWSKRAGFSIALQTDPEYWAQMLGSGWYLDWRMHPAAQSSGLVHWQMVRVHEECISPSVEEIQAAAKHNPGQVWIIGNEPDVIWQDNVTADRYAMSYHNLYGLIKAADGTALIAVGGISQATPLRLQYLDQVLQTYQKLYQEAMPVDWWTVHGYVLREEKGSWGVDIPPGMDATQGELYEVSDHGRIDLFEGQIIAFRQWMAKNGYQLTPLALTEFGILMPSDYGFTSDMVADYLEQTFNWLSETKDEAIGYPEDEQHLVQKWAWFSISDENYSTSDLGDLPTGKLTKVGERFRDMVNSMVR